MISLSQACRALRHGTALALAFSVVTLSATAQWNPAAGDWSKADAADLRVMTWNVEDGLCSTNSKAAGLTNWDAL
ncbi:MAG: hypothetical protein ACI9EF_003486, partial [Pseudohongiellaceae bacterium]